MDRFQEAQAHIDAMFEQKEKHLTASERIFGYAKRGVDSPEVLSHREVQQVCYALLAHYSTMGIE